MEAPETQPARPGTQRYAITGDRVALGPIERETLPLFYRWFNDFDLLRTAGIGDGPWTIERVEGFFKRFNGRPDEVWFMIYTLDTGQPIGSAGLRDIDERHGTAEYAISIGEVWARGQGYGAEVTRLLLDYAFNRLGLHNVALDVFANNPAGIRAYQKAGFSEFGRIRDAYVSGGRRWDIILMEAIARDVG